METNLYVIYTSDSQSVPMWVTPICATFSESWLKTFCELTEAQVEDIEILDLTVNLVGKRPDDRG